MSCWHWEPPSALLQCEGGALLQAASAETDEVARRKDYVQVQQILSVELPGLPLWYPDSVVVHSSRLTDVTLDAGGSFDFCRLRCCSKYSQRTSYFTIPIQAAKGGRRMCFMSLTPCREGASVIRVSTLSP
jgi:hypothetical protein